eukprot:749891-Hanusia_phi.AAC.2
MTVMEPPYARRAGFKNGPGQINALCKNVSLVRQGGGGNEMVLGTLDDPWGNGTYISFSTGINHVKITGDKNKLPSRDGGLCSDGNSMGGVGAKSSFWAVG